MLNARYMYMSNQRVKPVENNFPSYFRSFRFFFSYQKNPSSLRKLFDALKTISPSSIETERTCSVRGFYITKFRCSFGDQSINGSF